MVTCKKQPKIDSNDFTDRLYFAIFLTVGALILYGSLFPFEFSATNVNLDSYLLAELRAGTTNTSDALANLLLFFPLGLFGFLVLTKYHSSVTSIVYLSIIGGFLALLCQLLQLFLPSRIAALIDVYWNLLGLWLGIASIAPRWIRLWFRERLRQLELSMSLLIILLWLASRWLPLVPSIDWQNYQDAVKPLLQGQPVYWAALNLLVAQWLVAIHLLECHRRKPCSPSLYLALAFVVLMLEIVIVNNQITPNDIIGVALAAVIWHRLASLPRRKILLAGYLTLALCLDSLSPFTLRPTDTFHWLPFSGLLSGSPLINLSILFEKLYTFLAIFWLLSESNLRPYFWALIPVALIAVLEIMQQWIPGHTAELTDPLLAVFIATALFKYHLANQPVSETEIATHSASFLPIITKPVLSRSLVTPALVFIFLLYFSIQSLLQASNLPYNVHELFRFGGSGIDVFLFSLALLWLGFGSAWMGHNISQSERPAHHLPLFMAYLCMVLYGLIWMSVTKESLNDIVGSSVWVHRVGVRGVLGEPGIAFVEWFGPENLRPLLDPVERILRFSSLTGPLFILLMIATASLFSPARPSRKKLQKTNYVKKLSGYFIFSLPWMFLCKAITFDWSSTDNLNELISRDNALGMGGGFHLYVLVGLVVFNAAAIAWSLAKKHLRRLLTFSLLSLLSLPLGWLLLNAGLANEVQKYGLNYSGVDFFLGPDRSQLLSTSALFIRWTLLQTGCTFLLSAGMWLSLQLSLSLDNGDSIEPTIQTQSINFHLSQPQFNFLNDLAAALGETPATTTTLIFDNLQKRFSSLSAIEIAKITNLTTPKVNLEARNKQVTHQLRLTSEPYQLLKNLARLTRTSESIVARCLLDWFIDDCRES